MIHWVAGVVQTTEYETETASIEYECQVITSSTYDKSLLLKEREWGGGRKMNPEPRMTC